MGREFKDEAEVKIAGAIKREGREKEEEECLFTCNSSTVSNVRFVIALVRCEILRTTSSASSRSHAL